MGPEQQLPPLGLTRTHTDDSGVTLAVAGEIDLATVDRFASAMTELLAGGQLTRLVVDLDQVTFMDSSGVAALVAASRLAADTGAGFMIVNCRDTIRRVLEITGVYKSLTT